MLALFLDLIHVRRRRRRSHRHRHRWLSPLRQKNHERKLSHFELCKFYFRYNFIIANGRSLWWMDDHDVPPYVQPTIRLLIAYGTLIGGTN